jgi:uncharacterized integral membrane protein
MSAEPHRTTETLPAPPDVPPPTATTGDVTPRRRPTRAGAAWFGICLAALVLVVLVVFMLQNTRTVEVTFLWMHGSVPLALALLVASVGTAIATMVVGGARITQLRLQARRQRR